MYLFKIIVNLFFRDKLNRKVVFDYTKNGKLKNDGTGICGNDCIGLFYCNFN